MEFIKTEIPDVVILEPQIFGDRRGYFCETFRENQFIENVCNTRFVQDNESSSTGGVLRGLHYQMHPYSQSKLVRVTEGEVFDVAVDIRKGSPTFGKYIGVVLSAENKRQFFIPRGFAHGFLVLSEHATFVYKCDNYYNKASERGIRFDDPDLNIQWPKVNFELNLSDKDLAAANLQNADLFNFTDKLYE